MVVAHFNFHERSKKCCFDSLSCFVYSLIGVSNRCCFIQSLPQFFKFIMFVSRSIETDHKDLIHDVAFDFYGERLASCSSDQIVKVWDLGPDRLWVCTSSWKTHSGSVWKVTWAHPEFGQILATCSFDRTVIIWEELGPEGTGGERTQSQWVKKTSFVDSRTPVTDIKFAPKHLGLQLASCSADGVIRVYEAPDVMNLHQWSLQHEIPCKITCSCLSWNFCRQYPPLIVVGSDDPNPASGNKVLLYEYNENCRRWLRVDSLPVSEPVYDLSFAPEMARSFHYIAIASKSVQIFKLSRPVVDPNAALVETMERKFEIKEAGQFDHHNAQVWRVSWNITGTILASSGEDGSVRLWKANYLDKWKCVAVLKGDGSTEPSEMSQALSGETNPADLLGALSTMHFYRLTSSQPQTPDTTIN